MSIEQFFEYLRKNVLQYDSINFWVIIKETWPWVDEKFTIIKVYMQYNIVDDIFEWEYDFDEGGNYEILGCYCLDHCSMGEPHIPYIDFKGENAKCIIS